MKFYSFVTDYKRNQMKVISPILYEKNPTKKVIMERHCHKMHCPGLCGFELVVNKLR